MWFEKLMGFREESHEQVKQNIILSENRQTITSRVNGKAYRIGTLGLPNITELKSSVDVSHFKGIAHISQYVGDVQHLHADLKNKNAVFQVASQFNLLEMAGPNKPPEMGVDCYEFDYTQGPACAVSCGAATIYRNYFIPLNGQFGQTRNNQINCLVDVDKALNMGREPWKMVNGYALLTQDELKDVNAILSELDENSINHIKDKLRVGIQWDTQVTLGGYDHNVTQVYCSALPVAYSGIHADYWEPLAKLILEGAYEATLYTGLMNLKLQKSNKVYLTLLGGGAFGNSMTWISEVLIKVLKKFKGTPLDIRIVSYEKYNPIVNEIIKAVWE